VPRVAARDDEGGGRPCASSSADENSDGQTTSRRCAPIGSAFVTQHKVDFAGVPDGCQGDCSFEATRSK
jgi:hypothetical protein